MVTVDGAFMKKINRGVILKHIVQHEYISRADISQKTGLNKATVSVQVADLIKDDLIIESTHTHSAIGRKPIMLSINGKAGYVLGIDLDYMKILFTILNLKGEPIEHKKVTFDTVEYSEVLDILVKQIEYFSEKYSDCKYGLLHTIIGIHGIIDKDSEIITYAPRYQWANKNLIADVQSQIDIEVNLENNANLSAFAETVFKHHKSDHLITILLSSGIGSGIMVEGKGYRGHTGYAGELGHMIIIPGGKNCDCGNEGCWERYASEPVVIEQIRNFLNNPNVNYNDIQQLIKENNPIIMDYFNEFIKFLALGLNNVINLCNPETIVLNSELLKVYPNAVSEIEKQLQSSVSSYRNIVLSELGSNACSLGAGALAIKQFLEVPEVRFNLRAMPTSRENLVSNQLVY